MTKNIVFDFGEVLFSWNPPALIKQFFPELATSEQAAATLGKQIFGHPDWLSFDQGLLSLEQIMQQTTARLGLPAASVEALMAHQGERLQPIAGNVELLRQLAAKRDAALANGQTPPFRLYFLSNMPAPYSRVLEQRHAFIGWFDGGVFSGDALLVKPDAAIFQLLQTRHALEPAHTVFIDDSALNTQAASALGWTGLHLPTPSDLPRLLTAYL
jgi:putative hydrolase of the HAD superfamily